jgi:hypothetical protein
MPGPAYASGVISIAKNEDWIVPFLYGSTDSSGNFTPIDLTGSTIKLAIRHAEADHEALVMVSSPSTGITITDAPEGAFTIEITRSAMVALDPGDYVSDLIRVTPTGNQERLWEGTATVVQGTTR